MNPSFVIVSLVLLVGLAIFLFYYYSSKQVVLRTLKRLPRQRLGSLRTNTYSKIQGKALHVDGPLIAPLSGRECVFYQILIEQRVQRGKHAHWKTLVDDEDIQDFFIEQNGERCMVLPETNPRNFIAYLETDRTVKSGTFNNPTPEFMNVLKMYNINSEGFLGFNKRLRYKEAIIEVGERIVVAGNIKWMELENGIADYSYSKIASICGGDGKDRLIITDSAKAYNTARKERRLGSNSPRTPKRLSS